MSGDTTKESSKPVKVLLSGVAIGLALGAFAQLKWLPQMPQLPETPFPLPSLSLHQPNHPVCAMMLAGDETAMLAARFNAPENWTIRTESEGNCSANVYLLGLLGSSNRAAMASMALFEPGNDDAVHAVVGYSATESAALNLVTDGILDEYQSHHENPGEVPVDVSAPEPVYYRDGDVCLEATIISPMRDWADRSFAAVGLEEIDGRCSASIRLIAVSTPMRNLLGGVVGFTGSYAMLQRGMWGIGESRSAMGQAMGASLYKVHDDLVSSFAEDYAKMKH